MRNYVIVISSLRNGGSERVASTLVNEWVEYEDINVHLVVLTRQKLDYSIDSRVVLHEPNFGYKNSTISKSFYKIRLLLFVRKLIISIKPESVLSFNEKYNSFIILSLIGSGINVFVTDRNSPYINPRSLKKYLRFRLYKYVKGIIVQTDKAKQFYQRRIKNRNIRAIPNPLSPPQTTCFQREKIILNVGRLESQKNQLELIEIFSDLAVEDWKLVIVGSGSRKDELLIKIEELQLLDKVLLYDFTQDIASFYSRASIFALTSSFEGFPNALAEALSYGIPCVCYNCETGPSELIRHGSNGYLVDLGDRHSFKLHLETLSKDLDIRKIMGLKAIQSIQHLKSKNISKDYFNIVT